MKTTPAEQPYINLLKQRIEAQMAWGDSAHWTHQDFNELSERIWEGTQTKLSASTLKRLWEKCSTEVSPPPTRLTPWPSLSATSTGATLWDATRWGATRWGATRWGTTRWGTTRWSATRWVKTQ